MISPLNCTNCFPCAGDLVRSSLRISGCVVGRWSPSPCAFPLSLFISPFFLQGNLCKWPNRSLAKAFAQLSPRQDPTCCCCSRCLWHLIELKCARCVMSWWGKGSDPDPSPMGAEGRQHVTTENQLEIRMSTRKEKNLKQKRSK